MTTRALLHHLIDELPEGELNNAEVFLRRLRNGDPLLMAFANAPLDDEPLSAEDEVAIREAEEEGVRRGRPLGGCAPAPERCWPSGKLMPWRLLVAPKARRDFDELPPRDRAALGDALDQMIVDPGSVDLKKLAGQTARWRLRVGRWRAILSLDNTAGTITVLRVLPRGSADRA